MEKITTYIIPNITESVIALFNYNWTSLQSFDSWLLYCSDTDFEYIYEMEFKRHFLIYFTTDTESMLSIYAKNLAHAVYSFHESAKDREKTISFIRRMIHLQLKDLKADDLYFE